MRLQFKGSLPAISTPPRIIITKMINFISQPIDIIQSLPFIIYISINRPAYSNMSRNDKFPLFVELSK
jgi:hypothetical protein